MSLCFLSFSMHASIGVLPLSSFCKCRSKFCWERTTQVKPFCEFEFCCVVFNLNFWIYRNIFNVILSLLQASSTILMERSKAIALPGLILPSRSLSSLLSPFLFSSLPFPISPSFPISLLSSFTRTLSLSLSLWWLHSSLSPRWGTVTHTSWPSLIGIGGWRWGPFTSTPPIWCKSFPNWKGRRSSLSKRRGRRAFRVRDYFYNWFFERIILCFFFLNFRGFIAFF